MTGHLALLLCLLLHSAAAHEKVGRGTSFHSGNSRDLSFQINPLTEDEKVNHPKVRLPSARGPIEAPPHSDSVEDEKKSSNERRDVNQKQQPANAAATPQNQQQQQPNNNPPKATPVEEKTTKENLVQDTKPVDRAPEPEAKPAASAPSGAAGAAGAAGGPNSAAAAGKPAGTGAANKANTDTEKAAAKEAPKAAGGGGDSAKPPGPAAQAGANAGSGDKQKAANNAAAGGSPESPDDKVKSASANTAASSTAKPIDTAATGSGAKVNDKRAEQASVTGASGSGAKVGAPSASKDDKAAAAKEAAPKPDGPSTASKRSRVQHADAAAGAADCAPGECSYWHDWQRWLEPHFNQYVLYFLASLAAGLLLGAVVGVVAFCFCSKRSRPKME